MDVRVTQFGSETDNGSYELPEQHESDSEFEQRMHQQMMRQRNTRSEPLRQLEIPLDAFGRNQRGALHQQQNPRHVLPGRKAMDLKDLNIELPRRLNIPLEVFDRKPISRERRTRASPAVRPARSPPKPTQTQKPTPPTRSMFDRYQRIRNNSTPVVKDSDPIDYNAAQNHAIPSIEDSPLSRKSTGRGTPATGQSIRTMAREKVLSWDLDDDFDPQSFIESTPAFRPSKNFRGSSSPIYESPHASPQRSRRSQTAISAQTHLEPQHDAHELSPAQSKPTKVPSLTTSPSPKRNPTTRNRLNRTDAKQEQHAADAYPTPPPDLPVDAPSVAPRMSPYTSPRSQRQTNLLNDTPAPARPQLYSEDSRDVLRQLSRSVSNTPISVAPKPSKVIQRVSQSQANTFSAQPLVGKNVAGSLQNDLTNADASIQNHMPPQTPKVTGAWPDTPATIKAHNPAQHEPRAMNLVNIPPQRRVSAREDTISRSERIAYLESTAPSLPTSALNAIVNKVKDLSEVDGADVDNLTLDSLEDLLGELDETVLPTDADQQDMLGILEERIAKDLPNADDLTTSTEEQQLIRKLLERRISRGSWQTPQKARPIVQQVSDPSLTPRRRGRLEEEEQLRRMTERLNTVHSQTRSLNAGMGRLERKVAETPIQDAILLRRKPGDLANMFGWLLLVLCVWGVFEVVLFYLYNHTSWLNPNTNVYGPFYPLATPPFMLPTTLWYLLESVFTSLYDLFLSGWISSSHTSSHISSGIWNLFNTEVTTASISTASRLATSTVRNVYATIVNEQDYSMDRDEIIR